VWIDEGCLKERFPRIYALALCKNMTVEEALVGGRSGMGWEIAVMRNFNDWEVEEYESLLLFLSALKVMEENDKLLWKPKKNGMFSVKSYYEILLGMEDRNTTSFPSKQIWKIQAPLKIAFFPCEATRNAILMIDMLRKRGHMLVNCCYMCKR